MSDDIQLELMNHYLLNIIMRLDFMLYCFAAFVIILLIYVFYRFTKGRKFR